MKAFLGAIQSSLAIAMLIALGLGSLPAFAADSLAAGRKHAAKANQLAAKNKCKSAVVAFTKAYRALKDPTILFNRAECQRKLGNNADALMDYELFLSEMPTAPNRTGVEARIAALRESVKAESAVVPVAPVVPAAPAVPTAPAPAASAIVGATPPAQPPVAPAPPAQPISGGDTKPSEKASAAPVHRAEKWTD
jgi:hypothetical protein